VARELCGFVWQIFQLMAPRMTPAQGAIVPALGSRFGGELRNQPPHHRPPASLTPHSRRNHNPENRPSNPL
jgi:hypothetical protein